MQTGKTENIFQTDEITRYVLPLTQAGSEQKPGVFLWLDVDKESVAIFGNMVR